MSASGQKRTLALCQKRTIEVEPARAVPMPRRGGFPDSRTVYAPGVTAPTFAASAPTLVRPQVRPRRRPKARSFNKLGSLGEQCGWDRDAKCLCRLEINDRSKRVGCSTVKSPGFVPLRMLPIWRALERHNSAVLGPYDISPPSSTLCRNKKIDGHRYCRVRLAIFADARKVTPSPSTSIASAPLACAS